MKAIRNLLAVLLVLGLLTSCSESDGPSLLDQADILPHPDRLVGYWKMENNWNDSSGKDNHGAVAGGTPHFTTNAKVGTYAGSFDGASYVSVPDSASLCVTTSFTVMTWIYVAGPAPQDFWLFSKNVNFASGYGIAFDHNTAKIWPHLGINGGLQNPKASGSVTYAKWNLITVVYDGSKIEIYLNGTHDSTLSVSGAIDINNGPLYIANSPGSPGQYLDGRIDNLAIWDIALTPAEIHDVYVRQFQ